MRSVFAAAVVLSLSSCLSALADSPEVVNQAEFEIDLAKTEPTKKRETKHVVAGDVTVVLKNKVPKARTYKFGARVVRTLDPSLQLPEGLNLGSAIAASQSAALRATTPAPAAAPNFLPPKVDLEIALILADPSQICADLDPAYKALLNAKTEAEVPDLVKSLKARVKSCDENKYVKNLRLLCGLNETHLGCKAALEPFTKALSDASSLIARTSDTLEMSLAENEDLELSIASTSADKEDDVRKWEYLLVTPGDKRWFVSYGFAVSEDDRESYFTRPVEGEEGQFEVRKESDNNDQLLIPAVFFNARLSSWRSIDWLASGGLGVNSDTVSIFAGLGAAIHKNVSLVVGATVRSTDRLNGQYEVGQILGEDLDGDSLTEETYKSYFFLSLGFRFGAPPSTHKEE